MGRYLMTYIGEVKVSFETRTLGGKSVRSWGLQYHNPWSIRARDLGGEMLYHKTREVLEIDWLNKVD
jgi:hypothetical protein